MNPQKQPVSRRRFLAGASFGLATAAGLAACGDSSTTRKVSTDTADYPSYNPIAGGPTPDLPGSEFVDAAYYQIPNQSELFASVTAERMPNLSAPLSAFVLSYSPPPPADNTYLTDVEERVGNKVNLQISPIDSFMQKFATVTAGGDLPDMVQILSWQLPPKYPQLLEAQFQDLTEFLSGDAVSAYPNLANIPESSWVMARVNGRIYGTPVPRSPGPGQAMHARLDTIEKMTGEANPAPASKDEFLELVKAVHAPKDGRYALGGHIAGSGVNWTDAWVNSIFDVPNIWAFEGEKLVHMYETENFLEAISFVKELNDAGYFHPDTASMSQARAKARFANSTVVMYADGLAAIQSPDFAADAKPGVLVPFGADGHEPNVIQGSGSFSFTALKKAEGARIEEQLRFLNYLSAPFGSSEDFTLQFGTEGVHHKVDGSGAPTLTDKGNQQVVSTPLKYLGDGPSVQYSPTTPQDRLQRAHEWQEACVDMLAENPVLGLYSPASAELASEQGKVQSKVNDYVLGRSDLAGLKSTIETFTTSIANDMRTDFTEQLG